MMVMMMMLMMMMMLSCLPLALRVFPAETRLTVYRRPHIPGEGARGRFVNRIFRFQTVVRTKTARNLTIYFENLN